MLVASSALYWFVTERLRGGVAAAVLLHVVANTSMNLLAQDWVALRAMHLAVVTVLAVVVLVAASRRAGGQRRSAGVSAGSRISAR